MAMNTKSWISILAIALCAGGLASCGEDSNDNRDCGWLIGPYNWCSESSMWFIREANRQFFFLDMSDHQRFHDGLDIPLYDWMRWFMCKGRYVSGRTVKWDDLGSQVFPGYWTSVKNREHAVIFLYWTRPPYVPHPDNPASWENDPLNQKDEHVAWNHIAQAFDPNAKVNRFRCIAGNQGSRVRVDNYSIIRVSSDDEIDDWIKNSQRWGSASSHPFGGTPDRRLQKSSDAILFWRDGDFAFQEHLQDGFGITFGDARFMLNEFMCNDLGISP